MNKHVTNKILAAYIADILRPSERDRIHEHLNGCGPCRTKYERMVAAIAPRYSSLKPGDRVKEKIFRSWKEINNGDVNPEPDIIRSLSGRLPRWAVASAIGALAAILVAAVIIIQAPWETGRASLTMNRMDAGVTIDDLTAKTGDPVYEESRIKLSDKAIAQLVYDDAIQITLVNKSDYAIDHFSIEKDSSVKLRTTLFNGMLVSAIHNRNKSVSYEYMTPNARIEPLGTEFLLQVNAGDTLVIMKEGAIKARNIRSGKSVTVTSGHKCVISDSMLLMPTTEEDLKMFADLDKVRSGAYARLLLPAIYTQDVPAYTEKGDTHDAVKDSGNILNNDKENTGKDTRNENIKKEDARVERDRELRQQRMDQKKLQMNEMRRTNRNNVNQQMRKGR